jgi:vacuolar-type H+-ATPase subunit E/Vma4
MMAVDTGRMRDALRPLHAELLRRARAEADQILADANAEARDVLDGAENEAHRIIDNARAAGAAEALMAQAAERARTRRAHQSGVLAAQRNGYEQLRARATDAVHQLRDEPGYPALRERLAARAVQVLGTGTGVVVTEDPAGGIVAEAAGRRLDLSLTAFAERALERVEVDIDGLWS